MQGSNIRALSKGEMLTRKDTEELIWVLIPSREFRSWTVLESGKQKVCKFSSKVIGDTLNLQVSIF
jgi:hypothetical protein